MFWERDWRLLKWLLAEKCAKRHGFVSAFHTALEKAMKAELGRLQVGDEAHINIARIKAASVQDRHGFGSFSHGVKQRVFGPAQLS